MRIEILDYAEKELLNGFKFYERQSKGLGDYFLDSIFSDIESLHLYASIHARHFGYHRLLSKRLPFAIYCRLQIAGLRKEP
ncbi:MAG: type II toxin-antitoxin system RelE/ParE family toxin [Desulfobacterales bacterium]